MIRIGVISDTHLTGRGDELPAEVLEAFKAVDMIIHAGDILEFSLLEKLKGVCSNVKAVWGNMDPEETREKLPQKEIIKVGNYKIGIAHGYGHPAGLAATLEKIFKNDGVDVIIFGHSHAPFNEKKGKILFFNPGSLTDKVFAPFNSYGILEVNDNVEGRIIKI